MNSTRSWLLIGATMGVLALGAAALAMPAGLAQLAPDALWILILAFMPAAGMLGVLRRGRGQPAARSSKSASIIFAGCVLAGCLTLGAATASTIAAGPIAALVSFGLIGLLTAFSAPTRDGPLALPAETADPPGAETPAVRREMPRAEAA